MAKKPKGNLSIRLSASERALLQWAGEQEDRTVTQYIRHASLQKARETKAQEGEK